MTSKFEEALQTCLELILGGNETIETAVARFPEWSEALKPQLETALWLTTYKDVLEPRPGFVSASRRRLVERIKEQRQQAPLTWRERLQQVMPVQRVAPVAFVFILMLTLFVGGSLVSESKNALPGDRLYGMKSTLEGLALATSVTQASKAEIQIRQVQERLVEIRALIADGRQEDASQTVEQLATQITETQKTIAEVASQNPYQALDLYQELALILERQRSILSFVDRSVSPYVYYSLSQVLVMTEDIDERANDIRVSIIGTTPTSQAPIIFPSATPKRIIIKNTPTLAPTREPDEPTNTPEPTQPPPTSTSIPTQKPTSTLPPTSVPTNTPQPTWTNTPEPTATNTPEPPPTDTPEPPPTNTPVPSDTPTDPISNGSTRTPIVSPPPPPPA